MFNKENLFEGKAPEENSEVFTTLLQDSHIRIEAIRSNLKEPGQWYDQDEDEWVLVFEGEAELEIGTQTLRLVRGDHLLIPKHTPHRVLSTVKDTHWICVFSS